MRNLVTIAKIGTFSIFGFLVGIFGAAHEGQGDPLLSGIIWAVVSGAAMWLQDRDQRQHDKTSGSEKP